jgi:hypothetical protein
MLLALAFAASGCGGDPTSTSADMASGEILINGHPFAAISKTVLLSCDSANQPKYWELELWDAYGDCGVALNPPPNVAELQFQLPLNAVGTYNVNAASCSPQLIVGANLCAATPKSGTFTIVSQTMQKFFGAYDVVFMGGEHLNGQFDAQVCVSSCN